MQSCLNMLHGTSDKKCKRKNTMFIGKLESHMEHVFLISATTTTTTLDQICPQTLTLIALLLLSLLFHAIIIVVIVHRQHAAQCIQWIQGISPLLLREQQHSNHCQLLFPNLVGSFQLFPKVLVLEHILVHAEDRLQ